MRYEVRCCCQPDKLIGHIEGPADVLSFPIREKATASFSVGSYVATPNRLHRADLHHVSVNGSDKYLAVYSDDRPVEFWEKISGFEPIGENDAA